MQLTPLFLHLTIKSVFSFSYLMYYQLIKKKQRKREETENGE